MPDPTIVAIGGGGLGPEPEHQLLRDYISGLTGVERPRICLIPTATGDADATLVRFYTNYKHESWRPSHLMLFNRTVRDIEAFLLDQDAIFVGGGNTAAMLAIWRQHGVDEVLRKAWERGIVLCGGSAGAICWYESSVTDSFGPWLDPLHDGLAFLPGSMCPHYDGEANRRPRYREYIAQGDLPDGYAADDFVALRWTGTELTEIVGAKPQSRAWRLEKTPSGFQEREIVPLYLGKQD